jgi:chloride channel protein, CIC family
MKSETEFGAGAVRGAPAASPPRLGALADMQRFVRGSELAQIVLCAVLGIAVGAAVAVLRYAVYYLHATNFGLPAHAYLSAGIGVSRTAVLIVPLLGAALLALFSYLSRRWRATEIVDPIEANALHGGRLSLADSIRLTVATLISNGAGASLGMEAGYTQLGAAIYSGVGQAFRLRRADLRMFVTAGAAAAIAAAFNAPFAGAFYGFELMLGTYAPRALAPVAVAAVCGALIQRSVLPAQALFEVHSVLVVSPKAYLLCALLGVVAAGVAILTMRAATETERLLSKFSIPDLCRPLIGAVALSVLGLALPEVLGSGHGAIQRHLDLQGVWFVLAALLAGKLAASAVSIGSGFRGGLFSSALLLGILLGEIFAIAAGHLPWAGAGTERTVFMLAGMAAVGAGIIGAPLAMVFLVLESTSDFPVTVAALIAAAIASTIVRLSFGYSFSTWRFHLRGLGIRGAHDVGWIADLTVGRLMRSDAKVVVANVSLRSLRELYPPGVAKRLYAVDEKGSYMGAIDVAAAHDPTIDDALDGLVAGDLCDDRDLFLVPGDNVRTALLRFEALQVEALPVLASRADPRVIGYLTEAYALKRYSRELEAMRLSETGG